MSFNISSLYTYEDQQQKYLLNLNHCLVRARTYSSGVALSDICPQIHSEDPDVDLEDNLSHSNTESETTPLTDSGYTSSSNEEEDISTQTRKRKRQSSQKLSARISSSAAGYYTTESEEKTSSSLKKRIIANRLPIDQQDAINSFVKASGCIDYTAISAHVKLSKVIVKRFIKSQPHLNKYEIRPLTAKKINFQQITADQKKRFLESDSKYLNREIKEFLINELQQHSENIPWLSIAQKINTKFNENFQTKNLINCMKYQLYKFFLFTPPEILSPEPPLYTYLPI